MNILSVVALFSALPSAMGVIWQGYLRCGWGQCWCPVVHGVRGWQHQFKEPETNGCSMPLWPGNEHCCDAHDKCYCTIYKTKRTCENHFCSCLSWYNKGWCGGEIFTDYNYYKSQFEYIRCRYAPPRSKWHLVGRRRMEKEQEEKDEKLALRLGADDEDLLADAKKVAAEETEVDGAPHPFHDRELKNGEHREPEEDEEIDDLPGADIDYETWADQIRQREEADPVHYSPLPPKPENKEQEEELKALMAQMPGN